MFPFFLKELLNEKPWTTNMQVDYYTQKCTFCRSTQQSRCSMKNCFNKNYFTKQTISFYRKPYTWFIVAMK